MGVKGLTPFLEANFGFQSVLLKGFEAVVIDGNNICFTLYEKKVKECERGGEYQEFSELVRSFFRDFIDQKVKPIVVLDGLRESNKIPVLCERRKQFYSNLEVVQEGSKPAGRVKVIPTLVLPTFLIVIQELDIELHVSAGEGDLLVAAISNATPNCPVLSSDSDFFMYELRNGCIPYSKFHRSTCSLYHMEDFRTQFHLSDPVMRLLIPAVHGNDFISGEREHHGDIAQTIAELKKYKSCEEYLSCHEHLHCNYEAVKKQYCEVKSPEDILHDAVDNTSFPVNVSVGIGETSLDAYFSLLRITSTAEDVEDSHTVVNLTSSALEQICQDSVWSCSQYIRKYQYGLLGCKHVQEITRGKNSSDLIKTSVRAKCLIPFVALAEAVHLSRDVREGMLLTMLKCKKMSTDVWLQLLHLPPELKLPVATTFYWYKSSAVVDTRLVKALLSCFMDSSSLQGKGRNFKLEDVHAFCEWQSVYSDVLALNYMLHSPFQPTNPGMLYSGNKALFYASSKFLDCQFARDKMKMAMFAIVTSKEKKKPEVGPAPATAATSPLEDSNPFSLLSDMKD